MNFVKFDIKNRVGYLTLNRADKRNALNAEFVEEIKATLKAAENNPEVKVVVIKAAGDAFCAGADLAYLKSLQTNSYEENLADSTALMELFELIYSLKKVVIAQVEGHAIAGGSGLATVCDMVFAIPDIKFGYTEVKIGFIPAIVSIFLIRKIGEAKAKELLLSGNLIDSQSAHQIGIVNTIWNPSDIAQKVTEYAEKLCSGNSSDSMAMTKKLIADVQSMSVEDGLKHAAKLNAKARETEDCKKGIAAFLNKEKIFW